MCENEHNRRIVSNFIPYISSNTRILLIGGSGQTGPLMNDEAQQRGTSLQPSVLQNLI
jgi:hypothetical protein